MIQIKNNLYFNENNRNINTFNRKSNYIKCKYNTTTSIFKQKNDQFFTTNQFATTLKISITNMIKTFTKTYATNKLVFDFKNK